MGSYLRGCEEYCCEYHSRIKHTEDFDLPSDPILKEGYPDHVCRDAECKREAALGTQEASLGPTLTLHGVEDTC